MIQEHNKLINSREYKNWESKNKNAYLSSCVLINEPGTKELWHFDFYLPKANKITTFIVGENITVEEDQKIFEQSHKKLKKINLDEVKFSLSDIYKFIDKNFSDKKFLKIIIILQNLKTLLWNLSLLGNDFNLINVKVDAKTGKVVEQSTTSMLQFKAS